MIGMVYVRALEMSRPPVSICVPEKCQCFQGPWTVRTLRTYISLLLAKYFKKDRDSVRKKCRKCPSCPWLSDCLLSDCV